MLKINVRARDMFDGDIGAVFDNNYEREWFDDPLVQKYITEIDKNKILDTGVFSSEYLGIIGPEKLSGGTKALIMLYKRPEMEQWIGLFGNNCIPYLIELGKTQDIQIAVNFFDTFYPFDFDALFIQSNNVTHTFTEFRGEFLDVAEKEGIR